MTTTNDALKALERLRTTLSQLGNDEVLVLEFLAARLLVGQKQYGKLDLANDPRDWLQQRAEEQADRIMYDGFEEIKRAILAKRSASPPASIVSETGPTTSGAV